MIETLIEFCKGDEARIVKNAARRSILKGQRLELNPETFDFQIDIQGDAKNPHHHSYMFNQFKTQYMLIETRLHEIVKAGKDLVNLRCKSEEGLKDWHVLKITATFLAPL